MTFDLDDLEDSDSARPLPPVKPVVLNPDWDLDALYLAYGALLRGFYDKETPDGALDDGIRAILAMEGAGPAADASWVTSLDAAMGLIPEGSWFHWDHFGFSYVPNVPLGNAPVSNATDYHANGRPVSFEATGFDSEINRRRLPRLVCQAVFMARRAPLAKALAKRDGRLYLLQTGKGPLVANPEGRLVGIGSKNHLTADGRLIPYDPKIHGNVRLEDPYA